MKNNWRKVKLDNVCELIAGFAFKSKDFGAYPDKVVKITNIEPPFVNMTNLVGVDLSKYNRNNLAKFIVKRGDYVLAMTGATIGKLGRISNDDIAYINQRVLKFKPNDGVDKDFLFFILSESNFSQYILNHIDSESAQANISAKTIGQYEFELPPLDAQKRISAVLVSLDNKIELNEKINQNLEAQAQAIFKSWFVDFEPFGGKMPAGWGQGCLSDVLSVIESGSRPKGGSESSGVPSIGAENIDGIGHYDYSKEKYINRDFFQNLRHGKVNSGDILLYKDGAYVGKVSMALNGFPHEICAVNEHVFILRTNERLPSQSYLYLFLAQHSIRNKIATLGSAKAAQPGVNQSDIKGIALTIPNKRTIQAFENIASSLFSKIVQNSIQSRRLSQLRDTLLPKLMSGEIDVSNVAV